MADRRYLKRRGETWHYQRVVPADAIKKGWHGPNPIIVALGTRDLTVAQAERGKVHAEWQARIDKVTGRQSPKLPTPAEIEAEALDEFHRTLEFLNDYGGCDEAGLVGYVARQQKKLDDMADPSKVHPEVAKMHLDAARQHGIPAANIHIEGARPNRIVDRDYAMIKARIAAAEARRKAIAGVVPEIPQSFGRNSVDPVTLRPVLPRKGAKGGPKFADVAARFIAERQRDPKAKLTEQTREQLETAFRLFDSWAKQPCLGDIDRQTATSFLDTIAKLDPMWGRSGATKDRSFAEIFERFGNHPRGLANVTLSRHAGALAAIWHFAIDRDGFTGDNPWTRQSRAKSAARTASAHSPEQRLQSSLSASP